MAANSWLITFTIFQLTTGHCFDATYSECFHPNANNPTTCSCNNYPCCYTAPLYHHAKEHVTFCCINTTTACQKHLRGYHTLYNIFASEKATTKLCTFLSKYNSSLFAHLMSFTLEGTYHKSMIIEIQYNLPFIGQPLPYCQLHS
jgi:hypothetical protein